MTEVGHCLKWGDRRLILSFQSRLLPLVHHADRKRRYSACSLHVAAFLSHNLSPFLSAGSRIAIVLAACVGEIGLRDTGVPVHNDPYPMSCSIATSRLRLSIGF